MTPAPLLNTGFVYVRASAAPVGAQQRVFSRSVDKILQRLQGPPARTPTGAVDPHAVWAQDVVNEATEEMAELPVGWPRSCHRKDTACATRALGAQDAKDAKRRWWLRRRRTSAWLASRPVSPQDVAERAARNRGAASCEDAPPRSPEQQLVACDAELPDAPFDASSDAASDAVSASRRADAKKRLRSFLFTRALEEARESGDMIQDDVWRELARAKYLEWELLASDRDRRYSHLENSVRNFSSQLDAEDVSTMGEVIACARAPDDRSCEPPDAFCCKLTFEVFRDPVIAPSGHSYERLAILQHLKISQFDPITREPLRPEQLISNVNLRNASHAWLSTHAWAFGDIVRPNAPLE